MSFSVLLPADVVNDLEDIYEYVARHDSPGKADHILTHFEEIFGNLSEFPERGAYPKELLALGIRDYREIFFKPYRIIYRITGGKVYILLITDGRRDMQSLLQRRLLEQ